ncbi:MAG TPA: type II toxin-antitoxin system prevent-host-death family antitoxin [Rubrivivax sp.]|nr:type II toxin-antitoxin system prevent-host-death family antitoxin [Burkholderiales bacterium]HNU10501.1 type II toxin-antitoxin system prevent-host-death family antitoxin [Rubrivivax sp.]
MSVSATDAKNRFGQLLEQAQRAPVVIEKSGRRHSVLLSIEHYELLLSTQRHAAREAAPPAYGPEAQAFYAKYKDWVDMQNELVERYGVFGEEYRIW